MMVQYGEYKWDLKTITQGGKMIELRIPEVIFNAVMQMRKDILADESDENDYSWIINRMTDRQFASYLLSRGLVLIKNERMKKVEIFLQDRLPYKK